VSGTPVDELGSADSSGSGSTGRRDSSTRLRALICAPPSGTTCLGPSFADGRGVALRGGLTDAGGGDCCSTSSAATAFVYQRQGVGAS
jgi:hypothetical protein